MASEWVDRSVKRRIADAQKRGETKLFIMGLGLVALPREIGQLSNLIWLVLKNNQLTEVPTEIGQLSNLTWLDLSNNQLTQLPKEIGQLSNLTELDLSNNQLTQVPREIGYLSNLTELNLNSNPLHPELLAAYEQGLPTFLTFLRDSERG